MLLKECLTRGDHINNMKVIKESLTKTHIKNMKKKLKFFTSSCDSKLMMASSPTVTVW